MDDRHGAYIRVSVMVPASGRDQIVKLARTLRVGDRETSRGKQKTNRAKRVVLKMRWTDYRRRVKCSLDTAIEEHIWETKGYVVVGLEEIAEQYEILYPDHAHDIRVLAQTLVYMATCGIIYKIWKDDAWAYHLRTCKDSD